MIKEFFWVTSILHFTDVMEVTLRGDAVQGFDTRWDEGLSSITEMPQENVLEGLHKMRIRDSEQLQTVMALCGQDIDTKDLFPSDQRLNSVAKKFLDQKIRNRNFKPRKIEPRQEHRRKVEAKGGPESGERKQGDCYPWKAKAKKMFAPSDTTLANVEKK